jgi:hypothetical protein
MVQNASGDGVVIALLQRTAEALFLRKPTQRR